MFPVFLMNDVPKLNRDVPILFLGEKMLDLLVGQLCDLFECIGHNGVCWMIPIIPLWYDTATLLLSVFRHNRSPHISYVIIILH